MATNLSRGFAAEAADAAVGVRLRSVGRNSEAYCAVSPRAADYASLIRPTGYGLSDRQLVGRVDNLLHDEVNDAAVILEVASAAKHAGSKDGAACLLEDKGPSNKVSVRCFVFRRDEHDDLKI